MTDDITSVLQPEVETFGGIQLRKPTAGTLSLCDFAKLKITSGGMSEVPFFEAVAFFYIHSHQVKEVRKSLFDKSEGVDENGCTLKFINSVLQWADDVELGSISEMGDKIGTMLSEAMSPKVEPSGEDQKESDESIAELVSDDPKKN
jgi:hypothetical protein